MEKDKRTVGLVIVASLILLGMLFYTGVITLPLAVAPGEYNRLNVSCSSNTDCQNYIKNLGGEGITRCINNVCEYFLEGPRVKEYVR